MSLKAFHIVFVLATLALTLFLTVWAYQEFARTQSSNHLTAAICAAVTSLMVLVYGRFFLKKLKHISYQ